VDQQELVASDEDVANLYRTFVGEALDEDVDELILVVVVEHVGQPIGGEVHDSREDAVLAIGHELDRQARAGWVAWRRGRGRGSAGSAEDDAEAATEAFDHVPIVGAPYPRCLAAHKYLWGERGDPSHRESPRGPSRGMTRTYGRKLDRVRGVTAEGSRWWVDAPAASAAFVRLGW
jgi:hypothetical protein